MNEERDDILGFGHWPDEDDQAWQDFRKALSKRLQNSALTVGVMQLAWHSVFPDKQEEPDDVAALRELIDKDEFWKGQYEAQMRAIKETQQAKMRAPGKSLMDAIGEHLAGVSEEVSASTQAGQALVPAGSTSTPRYLAVREDDFAKVETAANCASEALKIGKHVAATDVYLAKPLQWLNEIEEVFRRCRSEERRESSVAQPDQVEIVVSSSMAGGTGGPIILLPAEPRRTLLADPNELVVRPRGLGLLRVFGWSPTVQAAATILFVVTLLGAGYGTGIFSQLLSARKQAHMHDFVEWVAGEDHPLVVAGHTVSAKGRVRGSVIERIRMTVMPGLQEGEEEWSEEKVVGGDRSEEAVLFDISFAAPADQRVRTVTVELVPHEDAHKASPEDLRPERLKREIRVACLAKGAVAYYPPAEPSDVVKIERNDQVWNVTILTHTSTGYATIATMVGGTSEYVVQPPKPVSRDKQELSFSVIPGDVDYFTVTPFASESGTAENLMTAIRNMDLANVEQGGTIAVTVVAAQFIDPPDAVRGTNHFIDVRVAPHLLGEYDFWLGVRRGRAPDEIWLLGSPIRSTTARPSVDLGFVGEVNEQVELLILKVPRGKVRSARAISTTDLGELGVEIAASHLVRREE